MLTSCKTLVCYHNHDIDIATIHRSYSGISVLSCFELLNVRCLRYSWENTSRARGIHRSDTQKKGQGKDGHGDQYHTWVQCLKECDYDSRSAQQNPGASMLFCRVRILIVCSLGTQLPSKPSVYVSSLGGGKEYRLRGPQPGSCPGSNHLPTLESSGRYSASGCLSPLSKNQS